ncbi:hypothetical protein TrLO_g6395 [Triparma laevis f. longispina]|uniref:GxGYxYP putative glycoside hydrolase C-terminal domain-containing protein n=1 Tax=Triparma laevis f. longispina TaxID=1714387 RepID=A0A9W6ZPV5_9STRA|nr:hypothetical protein TrLO_g6395 [Triparma laevis f. longispina]
MATVALIINQTYPITIELAAQTCCGLLQRNDPTSCYAIGTNGMGFGSDPDGDTFWLSTLYPDLEQKEVIDLPTWLGETCLAEGGQWIQYGYAAQKSVLPAVVTAAAHLSAVPIDVADVAVVFGLSSDPKEDLSQTWAELKSDADVYSNLASLYLKNSSHLVKQNPGYKFDVDYRPAQHHLTSEMDIGIVDFVVKSKAFSFFLPEGCVPFTEEHRLHSRIVREFSSTKSTPTAVYGYDDTVPLFGGDTYEAETNCAREHNLGQIASVSVNNLGFYSRNPVSVDNPLKVNPAPEVVYDLEKKYVAFVIGDGDNLYFLKKRNRGWVDERMDKCESRSCFPLTWTMSPRGAMDMPDIIRYYYDKALETGSDYFMLPPSGSLYSYPSQMGAEGRKLYAKMVEEDLAMMSSITTVHWEWFYSWRTAFSFYFPLFNDLTTEPRGFVLTNVPYMFPIFLYRRNELFKVIGENVVVFKPNEWRGTGGGRNKESLEDKANELNGLKGGDVVQIYATSDGGLDLDHIYDLVENYLDEDVVVVDSDTATRFALEAAKLKK